VLVGTVNTVEKLPVEPEAVVATTVLSNNIAMDVLLTKPNPVIVTVEPGPPAKVDRFMLGTAKAIPAKPLDRVAASMMIPRIVPSRPLLGSLPLFT
jgi:hypothetical protein